MTPKVVLDTNVFVAAGFNSGSSSFEIIERVKASRLQMLWHQATMSETQHILTRIPPLSWADYAALFSPRYEVQDTLATGDFTYITDPADRKFAALALAAGATLITNDTHLLEVRAEAAYVIQTPSEFLKR